MKSFQAQNKRNKILPVGFLLLVLITLTFTTSSQAKDLFYGNKIPLGQVIDQNLVLSGTDVTIDGTVRGDVLAIGQTITLNGQVDGTLVAIGEFITINNEVKNNMLAGGVLLQVEPNGKIGRELYFLGVRLTLPKNASIQRDLYLMSLEAQLAGKIGRNIHAVIGPVQIFEFFRNLIEPYIQNQINPLGAMLPTKSVTNTLPKLTGMMPLALMLQAKTEQQSTGIDVERLKKWGITLLRNFITLLIIGLLSIWLLPVQVSTASAKIQASWLRSLITGLVSFITGWFVVILAIIVVIMLTIFLFVLTLPNMGMLLGSLGLLCIGVATALFWLAIAYGSKIIVAYLIGRLILHRVLPKLTKVNLWSLILGIVLYTLVASIPYLGWVISTVAMFIGLGALWLIASPRNPKLPASVPPVDTLPL